jgi:hypothetical protein
MSDEQFDRLLAGLTQILATLEQLKAEGAP